MKKIVKHSIKQQFAIIFIGLMAATILVCWFINSTFLESYYIQNKQESLQTAYDSINAAASSGSISSEEFDIELQKIYGRYNISMVVVDAEAEVIKASNNDYRLSKQLMDNYWNKAWEAIHETDEKEKKNIIYENSQYQIRNAMDPWTQTEYIEMWGTLDNGNLFLLRTPKEGIRESVGIANKFLAYIGVLSVLISGILIWMITRKITEPIMELADISERMTRLDFEVKYRGKSKNEIGLLGEHINRLSETLEQTFSELKTANNELKTDIEKKQQIDEMRKEFLANVSHELKTPIALIQGYAEGLKEGISDDEESRDYYCDVIIDESAKMNTMVKKLLTLNQLEFGNDTVSMERFNIMELLDTCLQSADILLKQNEIQVDMEYQEPIYVWADEFKTEEVFTNYLSNAIHHCTGDKKIHVRVVKEENHVRIGVFNTGVPIPEDSIAHLWEKFYKVDKARTREYGGSGIGLSIVKAIMESMNQQYGVKNYEDGVEFWFELAVK